MISDPAVAQQHRDIGLAPYSLAGASCPLPCVTWQDPTALMRA